MLLYFAKVKLLVNNSIFRYHPYQVEEWDEDVEEEDDDADDDEEEEFADEDEEYEEEEVDDEAVSGSLIKN